MFGEDAHYLDLMESVRTSIKSITQAQQDQARLTATGYAESKRVTVVVNAQGVVIETRFSSNISDLSYDQIAAAVTAATQDAAAQVQRKTRAMIETLQQEQKRLPKLSEVVAGMPDVAEMLPDLPAVSTAPPGARERLAAKNGVEPAMEFTDAVPFDDAQRTRSRSGIAESGW